jgi:hypothetical protein
MPASGPWGTEITIKGLHFGPVPTNGSVVAFEDSVGASGFEVETWYDNEIRGRVAFPATGSVHVLTATGNADAGTFTADMPWQPSKSLDVAKLVQQAVLSTGDVVALFHEYEVHNEAALAVFGASTAVYPIDGLVDPASESTPVIARLTEADDHTPLVIATKHDGTVAAFGVQAGSLVPTATGLTGTVLATARDATGVYAWIDGSSGLVRARPGSPWTVDRGPIAAPHTPLDAAIAPDGTLTIVVSEPGPGTSAYLSLQTLGPTDPALGALERSDPTSYPGSIASAQLLLSSDGVHAIVLGTAMDGGMPTELPARLRGAAATWSDAPVMTGLVQYAFIGDTLAGLVNDPSAKTTTLIPDVTTPAISQVIPVWPMLSEGFVVDGGGKAHPLIGNGNVIYALTPP